MLVNFAKKKKKIADSLEFRKIKILRIVITWETCERLDHTLTETANTGSVYLVFLYIVEHLSLSQKDTWNDVWLMHRYI